jgi:hypothetical protein
VGLFDPTIAPFTLQVYAGKVPPFTGVAVNVSVVPMHTGFDDAVIETLTGSGLFTVIVIELEVAGFPVAQGRLEVIIHLTTFPLTGV